MHYLIKLLVEGKNRDEALANARNYADELVDCGEFDYHDFRGRWGDSKPYRVTSKKGQKLIEEAMQHSRQEFDRALTHVRYMIDNYSDDQIYEEDFGTPSELKAISDRYQNIYSLSRYMFSLASGSGNSTYLYAENNVWGGAIENQRSLNHVLKDNKKLWVVPVDFHN